MSKKRNPADLVAICRDYHAKHGRWPSAHGARALGIWDGTVREYFGTWRAFLAACQSPDEYKEACLSRNTIRDTQSIDAELKLRATDRITTEQQQLRDAIRSPPVVITHKRPSDPGREHLFIPDPQNRAGTPIDHLRAVGNYAVDRRPHVIIIAGDWWDMPSLSMWDSAAKKVAERRTYTNTGAHQGDIEAGNEAMRAFLDPIRKARGYKPEMHLALGNHEDRITRARAEHPELGDALSLEHLFTEEFQVHAFLEPFVIDGISYCHYYCVDSNGRVMQSKRGQASARAQVNNVGMSATAGHKQGLDTHVKECAGGRHRGVIAGSFYCHSEDFLTPQGNEHWKGCIYKHEVRAGDYDLMELSLNYLLSKWA